MGGETEEQRSRRKKAPKVFPKNRDFGKVFLSVFLMMVWVFSVTIVSQLLVGYLMVLILGADKLEEPVFMGILTGLSYSVALALVLFLPKKIVIRGRKKHVFETGTNRNELGLRWLPTWTDIGLAPAGFIVYLILASGLTAFFSLFPWFNASEVQNVGFNILATATDRVVAFLTLVIVAPIAEEVIFRGWLYGKMRARLGMLVSIFLVSLLFGIVHLQWNVGVNVFAMSVVLCGLREITGTIYAGILLHILKNGVAFYLLYVLGV